MTLTGLAADSTLAGGGNPRLGRRLAAVLAQVGVPLRAGPEADAMLTHLRQMYEPFVSALADRLLMPLPPWLPRQEPGMSGKSRRGGQRCGPPSTRRWMTHRLAQTCGVAPGGIVNVKSE